MWRRILNFFRLIFWWIVILAVIALIGFILWPILQNKSNTMSQTGWDTPAYADTLQEDFEGKITSFLTISGDATSDILTDESGKIPVRYEQDGDGVYRPVDVMK